VPITHFIKLVDRNRKNVMSKTDFDALKKWITKEFAEKAKLKMYQFINEKKEH
jgi:hypothetical protein